MSIDIDYSNRQLVPRLLPMRTANILSLNEKTNNFDTSLNGFEKENYLKLKREWAEYQSIIVAINILSYEIFDDNLELSKDVITYLNRNKRHLNPIESDILSISLRKMDDSVGTKACCDESIEEIEILKGLKNQSRLNMYNPVIWCDIGYYYTILGQIKQAERAYRIAISLNSSNTFIVRSVARFYLHTNQPDEAHSIILRSDALNHDPRLLSAEIALAEINDRKSKFIKKGIALANDDSIHISEKNELLSQLASIEFSYGKGSKGRKFVEKCLINPNENSLAQFEFLANKVNIDNGFNSQSFSVLCQYEALSRSNFVNSNFKEAFMNSKLWHEFQPFSAKPAILASYIAGTILSKHKEAIKIIEKARKTNPHDPTLLNNLAFSLAHSGKVEEASNALNQVNITALADEEKLVIGATLGLLKIKMGDIEEGKNLYRKTINAFERMNHDVYAARASYFYGDLIRKIDKDDSMKYLKKSMELSKKNNIIEINYLLQNAK